MLCKASWPHTADEEAAVCTPVSDKGLKEPEIILQATKKSHSHTVSQVRQREVTHSKNLTLHHRQSLSRVNECATLWQSFNPLL